MDESALRQRFASGRVAHLATVDDDGHPHIVPIVFALDGDIIYFAVDQKPKRTMRLQRLRNIASNPSVAVLVDHYEDSWELLWWVRADGTARALEPGDRAQHALALLTERYSQYEAEPPPGPVVAIAVERWTGWSSS
jgi:PPOX class probable F420-dependent enzyme